MSGELHLIKLSVGSTSLVELAKWQAARPDPLMHVTRMWPKREAELLDGGSIYWVIQGEIRVRQPLTQLHEMIGKDGIRRCGIGLARVLIPTRPTPRRAFQGWRYLNASDAPYDIEINEKVPLPAGLENELNLLGVG